MCIGNFTKACGEQTDLLPYGYISNTCIHWLNGIQFMFSVRTGIDKIMEIWQLRNGVVIKELSHSTFNNWALWK